MHITEAGEISVSCERGLIHTSLECQKKKKLNDEGMANESSMMESAVCKTYAAAQGRCSFPQGAAPRFNEKSRCHRDSRHTRTTWAERRGFGGWLAVHPRAPADRNSAPSHHGVRARAGRRHHPGSSPQECQKVLRAWVRRRNARSRDRKQKKQEVPRAQRHLRTPGRCPARACAGSGRR